MKVKLEKEKKVKVGDIVTCGNHILMVTKNELDNIILVDMFTDITDKNNLVYIASIEDLQEDIDRDRYKLYSQDNYELVLKRKGN